MSDVNTPSTAKGRCGQLLSARVCSWIETVGAIVLLLAAGIGWYWLPTLRLVNRPSLPLPVGPVALAGAHLEGSNKARVAIIEFSDFQCPACAQFTRDTLPRLRQRYVKSGKVLLAFHPLPLQGIHPRAFRASVAAECAARQGRFWPMHDGLFKHSADLTDPSISQVASAIQPGSDRL